MWLSAPVLFKDMRLHCRMLAEDQAAIPSFTCQRQVTLVSRNMPPESRRGNEFLATPLPFTKVVALSSVGRLYMLFQMRVAQEIFCTWRMRTDERSLIGMGSKMLRKLRRSVESFGTAIVGTEVTFLRVRWELVRRSRRVLGQWSCSVGRRIIRKGLIVVAVKIFFSSGTGIYYWFISVEFAEQSCRPPTNLALITRTISLS